MMDVKGDYPREIMLLLAQYSLDELPDKKNKKYKEFQKAIQNRLNGICRISYRKGIWMFQRVRVEENYPDDYFYDAPVFWKMCCVSGLSSDEINLMSEKRFNDKMLKYVTKEDLPFLSEASRVRLVMNLQNKEFLSKYIDNKKLATAAIIGAGTLLSGIAMHLWESSDD